MPEPRAEHRILVADVGGTFARFALARGGRLLGAPHEGPRDRWPDLASACRAVVDALAPGVHPDGVVIAGAGRVQDGRIEMTNACWAIDRGHLAAALGLPPARVVVINDFAALAVALPGLAASELGPATAGSRGTADGPPAGRAAGHRVVVGPGTGLGVAALLRSADGWLPLATEGGHAGFAPQGAFEHAAAELALRRYGRASWERVLSGPGLALLHAVAREQAGWPAAADDPAEVLAARARGEPPATAAVQAFVGMLGAFAGDLALLYDAAGGVVIAGGMVPRIAAVHPLDGLRERFEAKGRFRGWLEQVPLALLAAPHAALRGAAAAYLQPPDPAGPDG
jgi:glucokinase